MNQNYLPQYNPPMGNQFQRNNQFNQSLFNNSSQGSVFQQPSFSRADPSMNQPTFFSPSPMKFRDPHFGQNRMNQDQNQNQNYNTQSQFNFVQRESFRKQTINHMTYQPSYATNWNSNVQNTQMNFQGHTTSNFNTSLHFDNSFNNPTSNNSSYFIPNDHDVNYILLKGISDLNPKYATDVLKRYAELIEVKNVSKSQGAFLFKFKGSFDSETIERIRGAKSLELEPRYPNLDIKFLSKSELDKHQRNLSKSIGNLSLNQSSSHTYGYNSNAYVNTTINDNWESDQFSYGQDNKPFWKYLLELLFKW